MVGVDWAKAPNTPMRIKLIHPLVSFPDFSDWLINSKNLVFPKNLVCLVKINQTNDECYSESAILESFEFIDIKTFPSIEALTTYKDSFEKKKKTPGMKKKIEIL